MLQGKLSHEWCVPCDLDCIAYDCERREVVLTTQDSRLYCYDLLGKVKWETKVDSRIQKLQICKGQIWTHSNGKIQRYDEGKLKAVLETSSKLWFGDFVINSRRICFETYNAKLFRYTLNTLSRTGQLLHTWSYVHRRAAIGFGTEKYVFVTSEQPGILYKYDWDGTFLEVIKTGEDTLEPVRLIEHGKFLYVSSREKSDLVSVLNEEGVFLKRVELQWKGVHKCIDEPVYMQVNGSWVSLYS